MAKSMWNSQDMDIVLYRGYYCVIHINTHNANSYLTFLSAFSSHQKQTRFDAADKGEDFDKAVKEIKKDKEEK